jgi:hypothetical protein
MFVLLSIIHRSLHLPKQLSKVARWYIWIPKIPIWVYFEGHWNAKCWYNLWTLGIFYCHLVYDMALWYIFWPSGIYFSVLAYVLYEEKSGNPAWAKLVRVNQTKPIFWNAVTGPRPRQQVVSYRQRLSNLTVYILRRARLLPSQQGCQIFLGTKYQNGKKYTKLPQTVPNAHKLEQKTLKWTNCL